MIKQIILVLYATQNCGAGVALWIVGIPHLFLHFAKFFLLLWWKLWDYHLKVPNHFYKITKLTKHCFWLEIQEQQWLAGKLIWDGTYSKYILKSEMALAGVERQIATMPRYTAMILLKPMLTITNFWQYLETRK